MQGLSYINVIRDIKEQIWDNVKAETETGCLLPRNLADHVYPFLTTSSTFIPVCSRLTGCYSPHKTHIIFLSSIKTRGKKPVRSDVAFHDAKGIFNYKMCYEINRVSKKFDFCLKNKTNYNTLINVAKQNHTP